VGFEEDSDRIHEIAAKAWARLKKDTIVPAPRNFEVWYMYYASEHAELRKEIDALIAQNGKVTGDDCYALHEKFLAENRHDKLFQKAGDHIHDAIEDVSAIMDDIRDVTSEYSGTLNGVSTKLSSATTKEEIAALMRDVMSETKKMIEHNAKLEEHLDQSAEIMETLKKDLEQVRREAMTDGLTGLTNRKSFDERIRQITEQNTPFTLLFLDIDHFKPFNDNFGHQVGDQVLRLVAKTLIDGVKGRDTAARYGGEEFAIILPETTIEGGRMVAENLRKAIAQKEVVNRTTGQHLGRITISAGVAQHVPGEDAADLIDRADAALYTAKHNGRNQVATAPTPPAPAKQA
jgi:diguanylate cyclase